MVSLPRVEYIEVEASRNLPREMGLSYSTAVLNLGPDRHFQGP